MFSDSGNPYLMDEDALVDISPEGTGFMVKPSHHIAHDRIVLSTIVQVYPFWDDLTFRFVQLRLPPLPIGMWTAGLHRI